MSFMEGLEMGLEKLVEKPFRPLDSATKVHPKRASQEDKLVVASMFLELQWKYQRIGKIQHKQCYSANEIILWKQISGKMYIFK